MNYDQYDFFTKDEWERSRLISLLNDYRFEGYEETEEVLRAYISSPDGAKISLQEILRMDELGHIRFQKSELAGRNWNEEWEKNFEPVVIAGRVGIRAPFHAPIQTEMELVIEPKMSFGTGHHPTTSAVIELMLEQNFENRSVLDFGSGTGVLAILAEKLSASKVLAIDHEEWAYHNCMENVERNGCRKIQVMRGSDILVSDEKYDFILANINRNVILEMINRWSEFLSNNGRMIVSGILHRDEQDVAHAASKAGLKVEKILQRNDWSAISFVR